MKFSECNTRQKKAYANIYHAANWIIGGLENTMLDNLEGSEEWQNAKNALEDHEALVLAIYDAAISDIYTDGACYFGADAERFLKDIRFCGREWLMERVEARVKKCGY